MSTRDDMSVIRPNKATFFLALGKILSAFGLATFAILFISTLGLGGYLSSFPLTPDAEAGQTICHNNHGTCHYVTAILENTFFWFSQAGFYSCALIPLGGYLIMRNQAKK
jgi:hypothetical protein